MTTDIQAAPTRAFAQTPRILDIVVATAGLLLTSPLLAVISAAIKATSPGPILFRQQRVGLAGEPFTMLKFRSMTDETDDAPHRAYVTALLTDTPDAVNEKGVFKLAGDPRITRVGSIIRRFSLDELPQLLTVLKGDMSVVGPRPALPFEVDLYQPADMVRFVVRPGLTGLWQVSGRNRLTMRQMLEIDVEYVRRKSLRLDLQILAKTLPAVIRGDGAE